MDLERDGNLIEAGVWFLLAMILLVHTIRSDKGLRPTFLFLVVTLAIFGASDLVEARRAPGGDPGGCSSGRRFALLRCSLGLFATTGLRENGRLPVKVPDRSVV